RLLLGRGRPLYLARAVPERPAHRRDRSPSVPLLGDPRRVRDLPAWASMVSGARRRRLPCFGRVPAHRHPAPPRPGAHGGLHVRFEQDLGQQDQPPGLPEADRLETEDVAQGHAPQPRDQDAQADEEAEGGEDAERRDPRQVAADEAALPLASLFVGGHGERSFQMTSTRYSASFAETRSMRTLT